MHFAKNEIPIENHGFDPIDRTRALSLINGFKSLQKKGLDNSFNSFFLPSDENLDSLLSNSRITGGTFDGYRILFGIDGNGRLVLFLEKEKGEIVNNREVYTKLPSNDILYDAETGTSSLIEMSDVLSSEDGNEVTIDGMAKSSPEYWQWRNNFEPVFFDQMAQPWILTGPSLEPEKGATPPPLYYNVKGYFVGLGILNHIRPYKSGKGLKFFFGYGPSRNQSPFKNLHLIVIGTENANQRIEGFEGEIWATFDTTVVQQVVKNGVPAGRIFRVKGGSSCVRPGT